MARYALVDPANTVANVTEWDGVTPYNPAPDVPIAIPAGDPVAPGWTWNGATFDPPPPVPLADVQAAAVAVVLVTVDERSAAGFPYLGQQIAGGDQSLILLTGAVVGAAGLVYPIRWPNVDGTAFVVLATALDVQLLFGAAATFTQATQAAGADTIAAINAAGTTAQVDAILALYLG